MHSQLIATPTESTCNSCLPYADRCSFADLSVVVLFSLSAINQGILRSMQNNFNGFTQTVPHNSIKLRNQFQHLMQIKIRRSLLDSLFVFCSVYYVFSVSFCILLSYLGQNIIRSVYFSVYPRLYSPWFFILFSFLHHVSPTHRRKNNSIN